jgi:hypothetical protein
MGTFSACGFVEARYALNAFLSFVARIDRSGATNAVRQLIGLLAVMSVPAWASDAPGQTNVNAAPPQVAAPAQLPAWMNADVVKAAVAINMTDVQQHAFNETVGQFVTDHFAMIQKEAKREAPDLEQRVKSRDGALVREMDTRVGTILTKDQLPAYENYKKALRTALKSAPLPQTSTGTRSQHGIGGGQG